MLMAVKVVKATKSVAAAAALIYVFSPNTRPPPGGPQTPPPPNFFFLGFLFGFSAPNFFLEDQLNVRQFNGKN